MFNSSGNLPLGNIHRETKRVRDFNKLLILISRCRAEFDRPERKSGMPAAGSACRSAIELGPDDEITTPGRLVQAVNRKNVLPCLQGTQL